MPFKRYSLLISICLSFLSSQSLSAEVMTEAELNQCVRLGLQIAESDDFFYRSEKSMEESLRELKSVSSSLDNLENIGSVQQSTLKICMMNASNSGMSAQSYCWSEVHTLNETSDRHRNLVGEEKSLRAKLRKKEELHNAKVRTDKRNRNRYDDLCLKQFYTQDYEAVCQGESQSIFCQ